MAKMIKHKDSFVNTTLFATMFNRVHRINKASETSSVVSMEDQTRQVIEVKVPYSMEVVLNTLDNKDYEGEIAHHLFSYYIGEV